MSDDKAERNSRSTSESVGSAGPGPGSVAHEEALLSPPAVGALGPRMGTRRNR